ncbi:MAG: atpH [Ferruginibacter sp.]|nr:atpH [Ferruginibacter sp.]
MNNPRLAGRYAKSLLDLAIEQNVLDAVYADMKFLDSVSKSNPDFVALLRSPVIASDKKEKIIEAVTESRVQKLTSLFVRLLITKARESNLPEIAKAFIAQYNEMKHIHSVKLTTAVAISPELQQAIGAKIQQEAKLEHIELETSVDDELIGGFKLELGDTLIDASILRDLLDVKKQFLNNDYIHQIR